MTEIEKLFERQTLWQKSLRDLPWPEKMRMVEAVRESVEELRRGMSRQED
jgi:hypothetical protein